MDTMVCSKVFIHFFFNAVLISDIDFFVNID